MEVTRTVRPTIASRQLYITRSSAYGPSQSSRTIERSSRTSYGASSSGALALLNKPGSGGFADVRTNREKEKRDMQDLNERFASYIEKVRFLEAQNRRLGDELERLKAKWGKETTHIKVMYETELEAAKKLLEEAEKEKARLEQRVAALEEEIEELRRKLEETEKAVDEVRDKIDQQNSQLGDLESEINMLKRRIESLTADRDKDKRRIAQLQDALNRARIDLDNETLLHIDAENRRQALEDELEFLKQVHEQELKELAALAYRDTTNENREFWRNEMGNALRDIQQIYDEKLEDTRNDVETYYNLKVQEFRTTSSKGAIDAIHSKEETTRLRTQIGDLRAKLADLENKNDALQRELDELRQDKEERERQLQDENADLQGNVAKMRAELEAIMKELQDLMDTKLGLELEIAAYRKLLEGEENRSGLRQVVDSMYEAFSSIGEGAAETATLRTTVRGEMSAKTTHSRSAKGPTSIGDCSPEGKFVTLENTGRKEENLSGWSIRRNVDGEDFADYPLGQNVVLKPGSKLKLWASGSLPADAKADTDIETTLSSWGTGNNVTTKLCNPAGEDRATHVQKTVMS